jgi:hypothetical protein
VRRFRISLVECVCVQFVRERLLRDPGSGAGRRRDALPAAITTTTTITATKTTDKSLDVGPTGRFTDKTMARLREQSLARGPRLLLLITVALQMLAVARRHHLDCACQMAEAGYFTRDIENTNDPILLDIDLGLKRQLAALYGNNIRLVQKTLDMLDAVPTTRGLRTVAFDLVRLHFPKSAPLYVKLSPTMAMDLKDFENVGYSPYRLVVSTYLERIRQDALPPRSASNDVCDSFRPKTFLTCCNSPCDACTDDQPLETDDFGDNHSGVDNAGWRAYESVYFTEQEMEEFEATILRPYSSKPHTLRQFLHTFLRIIPKERVVGELSKKYYSNMLSLLASLGVPMDQNRFFKSLDSVTRLEPGLIPLLARLSMLAQQVHQNRASCGPLKHCQLEDCARTSPDDFQCLPCGGDTYGLPGYNHMPPQTHWPAGAAQRPRPPAASFAPPPWPLPPYAGPDDNLAPPLPPLEPTSPDEARPRPPPPPPPKPTAPDEAPSQRPSPPPPPPPPPIEPTHPDKPPPNAGPGSVATPPSLPPPPPPPPPHVPVAVTSAVPTHTTTPQPRQMVKPTKHRQRPRATKPPKGTRPPKATKPPKAQATHQPVSGKNREIDWSDYSPSLDARDLASVYAIEGRNIQCNNPAEPSCKFKDRCGAAPKNMYSKGGQLTGYVVNGESQTYGEWPSYVRLEIDGPLGSSTCGGALVTDRHVLTAAHCVVRDDGRTVEPRGIEAILGDHRVERKDEHEVKIRAKSVCAARRFNPRPQHRTDTHDDWALIELARPVELTGYVDTACLPFDPLDRWGTHSRCFLVGAGATGFRTVHGIDVPDMASVVQKLRVEQVSCRPWGLHDLDRSRECYSKARNQPGDSCSGDSGGPVLCLDLKRRWTVTGLVSFGTPLCNDQGKEAWVGVYARVRTLLPDIKQQCHF